MTEETIHPIPVPPRRGVSLLLWCNFILAAGLAATVLIAPFVAGPESHTSGWYRLLGLFARDATLRQTALAAAIGLMVTALVFFRSPAAPAAVEPKSPAGPPSNVVGA